MVPLKAITCWVAGLVIGGCATTSKEGGSTPTQADTDSNYVIPEKFECDAKAGSYGLWKQTLTKGPIRVSGTVRVLEQRRNAEWASNALVLVGIAPKGTGASIIFNGTDKFRVELLSHSDLEAGFGAIPATVEPIPFQVLFDSDGTGSVLVGGITRKVTLKEGSPLLVSLGCGSSRVLFDHVVVATQSR